MRLLLIPFLLFISIKSMANQQSLINLADRINSRQFMLKRHDSVFQQKAFFNKELFKKELLNLSPKKYTKALLLIKTLDRHFPEKILMAIVYWRIIAPSKINTRRVFEYYFFYKLFILRDYIDDPFSMDKSRALSILRKLANNKKITTFNLFAKSHKYIKMISSKLSLLNSNSIFQLKVLQTPLVHNHFERSFGKSKDYLLSYFGFIPGNKVELINTNNTSYNQLEWFKDKSVLNIFNLDSKTLQPLKMPSVQDVFGHPSFNQPIFSKIRNLIVAATDSIFIDIFLLGGTIGKTLTTFLLQQVKFKLKNNPNFKVLILHDYATNYGLQDEMLPIFKSFKQEITNNNLFKNSIYLLQANIQRHPPGIPLGITKKIAKSQNFFNKIEQRSTYFESKMDHSKLMVIDGNTNHPKAYLGSKNWTDHSGGYHFDNMLSIEGPSAALIQASYLEDIKAALTQNEFEQSWFYFKNLKLDNKNYLKQRDKIINNFKIKKKLYPVRGGDILRLNETNVDSEIRNTRNILIDMIIHSKKSIYMEQLFIYDSYIIDALIKKKIMNPKIDIKIIIDANANWGLNGLPNTLFLKEMKSYGIKIKSRILFSIKEKLKNNTFHSFHQENHRKITSIDGRIILIGSSNLNPDSLQGSFREIGVQLFNKFVAVKFNNQFLKDWSNTKRTKNLNIDHFFITYKNNNLSKKLSKFINQFGSYFYRNKESLEKPQVDALLKK